MDNTSLNNSTREFVWKINKTPKAKAKTPKTEPSTVRELVEKQFQNLSMILFDKINTLENEINSIKRSNTMLENQLTNSNQTSYVDDFIYDPWYL